MLRVFGVRFQASGPMPPRGAFLASNHTTWLDILVISAWMPTNFIAKKEVGHIPGIGFLSGLVGTLFLDRESQRDAHRLSQELRALLAVELTEELERLLDLAQRRRLELRRGVVALEEGAHLDLELGALAVGERVVRDVRAPRELVVHRQLALQVRQLRLARLQRRLRR